MKIKQVSAFVVELDKDPVTGLDGGVIRFEYDKEQLDKAKITIQRPNHSSNASFECDLEPLRLAIKAFVDANAFEYAEIDESSHEN